MTDPDDEDTDDHEMQSEAVKQCAESVMEDNPEMDKSTAFAVCQSMENQGQLTTPNNDELNEMTQPIRALADAEMEPPGPIQRSETSEGIQYSNILILAPGEWTDGATGEAMYYSPDLTEHIASSPKERVPERNGRVQNIVNFDHNKGEQLAEIGHFDVDSLTRDTHGNLYADITLWNDTTASQDAVALMDRALQTEGQQGAGGFSVEIPFENEVTEFDRERGLEKMVEGDLAGLAIARESASAPAATAQQFADRAIALSGGDEAGATYMVGGTLTDKSRQTTGMDAIDSLDALDDYDTEDHTLTVDADGVELSPPDEGDAVAIEIEGASIDEIRDALTHPDAEDEDGETSLDDADGDEEERDLDGMDMVASVVDEFLAEDGSPDDGVDMFLDWARENTDADIDALEAAAADYLAEVDADDLGETPVSEFMSFLDERAGDEEEEENSGHEDEDEEGEMSEELEALREDLRELESTNEELRDRVKTLEEEPEEPRSMAAHASGEEKENGGGVVPSKGGFSQDGDYYGR